MKAFLQSMRPTESWAASRAFFCLTIASFVQVIAGIVIGVAGSPIWGLVTTISGFTNVLGCHKLERVFVPLSEDKRMP
jgi:hypothetical protein